MDFSRGTCALYVSQGFANLWLSERPEDQDMAVALCGNCPLRIQCKQLTDRLEPGFGVWAGTFINQFAEAERKERVSAWRKQHERR